jgi:hypothetical protein
MKQAQQFIDREIGVARVTRDRQMPVRQPDILHQSRHQPEAQIIDPS